MSRRVRYWVVLPLLMTISGIYPAIGAEPSGSLPIHRDTIGNLPQVELFPAKRYHLATISLPKVLVRTGAYSPEIRISRRRVDVSYAVRGIAIESFFPSISGSVGTMTYSGEVQNSEGNFYNILKQQSNTNHGLILSVQPGSSAYQTVITTTRIDQTKSQLSETVNQKYAFAARLYFDNLASLSRVAVLRRAVDISRRILREERKLVELGGASIVGVLRAAHEVARDSRHLVEEEKMVYHDAFRLDQIMGEDSNTLPIPAESFILPRLYIRMDDDLDSLLEISDTKRPLIRDYAKNEQARAQELSKTYFSPLVPTIGVSILNGSLGPDFNSLIGYNETLFFALWTVGPGGILDPAAINLAGRNKDEATAELSRTRIIVHREVRDSFEQVRKSLEEEKIAVEDMRLARLTFLASRKRVQLGVYHALELIVSLRDLVDAQLKYIEATRQFEEAQFDLLAAIGIRPDMIRVPVPVGPPLNPEFFSFTSEGKSPTGGAESLPSIDGRGLK